MTLAEISHGDLARCAGKPRLTMEVAQRVANDMRRRKRGRISAYKCRSCGWWHVGASVKLRGERG